MIVRQVLTRGLARAASGLLCVGLLGLPGTAGADWLVLTDGSALKIKGEAKTRGKMVVFTLPDGKLASLKLADVDLEASAERTESEARRWRVPPPKPPEPEPPKEAVFVLTDADVGHVEPATAVAEAATDPEGEAVTPSAPSGQRLVIRQWGQEESGLGVKVFGILENRDANAAGALQLAVTVLDDDGGVMADQMAGLDVTTLLPGQTTRFEALFEDLPSFNSIDFKPQSVALKAGSGEGPQAESEEWLEERPEE